MPCEWVGFSWDLARMDWNTVSAIMQIILVAFTMVSLIMLGQQIRDNQRIAEDNRKQAEQAAHDAVIPELVVESLESHNAQDSQGGPLLKRGGGPIKVTFAFANRGLGPAIRAQWSAHGQVRYLPEAIATGLYPYVSLEVTEEQVQRGVNIDVEYRDVLGWVFRKTYQALDRDSELAIYLVQPDGSLGSRCDGQRFLT